MQRSVVYAPPRSPVLHRPLWLIVLCREAHSQTVQVSHHPPVACMAAQGPGYSIIGEMQLVSSFWGKTISMTTKGGATATLSESGETYNWKKPTFTINNIILGKPWIEAVGTTDIACSNGAPFP